MMKKLLITLTALTSFSFINAQEDEIRFGAKAGLNIATITGDEVDGLESKIGFNIGAVVEIPLSDVFALQPELIFSSQGAKFEESEIEAKIDYNYLNIPVLAKYYVAEGLSLQAGPQLGILLSANQSLEGAGEDDFDEDVKEFSNSIDLGINFGIGYQLEVGLFFDARYNLGLSNVNDFDFDDFSSDDLKQRNSVFQISVGYKF